MDIVELGLMYDVEVDGSSVKVLYSLTSMGCPAGAMIADGIVDVARKSHGRAIHGQLLPPQPIEAGGRTVAGCGTTDNDPSFVRRSGERALPRRFADRLDDDVDASASGRLPHDLDDVVNGVVDEEVRAGCCRELELLRARRGHDRPRAERTADLERSEGDAAA